MISLLEKHSKLSWLITILMAILIFYVSSLQFPPAPQGDPGINAILYHIIAFFALAFFLLISLTKGKNKSLIPLAIILAIFYALADEFHQSFVPGRASSLQDVALDSLGVIFATMFYLITLEYRKQ